VIHIQGDIVLHEGKEKVVTDVSPFPGNTAEDRKLDRLALRPKEDPDGKFTFGHPDECQIIGHLKPGDVPGWRERGPNDWVRV
jgi:hypothetical protein